MSWYEGHSDLEAPSDVQEQQEKDEANAADPEALLRKREREAEEWRVSQLRAGVSAEDNANLQVGTVQQPCLLGNSVAGPHLAVESWHHLPRFRCAMCSSHNCWALGGGPCNRYSEPLSRWLSAEGCIDLLFADLLFCLLPLMPWWAGVVP